MLLTKPQQFRFFREWKSIVESRNWDRSQAEAERHALIERCGFTSLTHVDPSEGFTAVLKELAAMNDNIGGMLNADANKRRQKIYLIKRVPAAYWQKIALDRFQTDDLDTLKDWQIDQLLFTVSDRQAVHSPGTLQTRAIRNRHRRATPDPEARIKFPDLADSYETLAREQLENCPF